MSENNNQIKVKLSNDLPFHKYNYLTDSGADQRVWIEKRADNRFGIPKKNSSYEYQCDIDDAVSYALSVYDSYPQNDSNPLWNEYKSHLEKISIGTGLLITPVEFNLSQYAHKNFENKGDDKGIPAVCGLPAHQFNELTDPVIDHRIWIEKRSDSEYAIDSRDNFECRCDIDYAITYALSVYNNHPADENNPLTNAWKSCLKQMSPGGGLIISPTKFTLSQFLHSNWNEDEIIKSSARKMVSNYKNKINNKSDRNSKTDENPGR